MTDRELLELAAKAAGIKKSDAINRIEFNQWNPLTDDGDALRLATEIKLNVFHAANSAYALPSEDVVSEEQRVLYGDAGGKHSATRRAIVRAAAEIGKGMK